MTLRLVLLALTLAAAFGGAALFQRRRPRARTGLPPGLVLVTGPGCGLCEPARQALLRAGIEPITVDVGEAPDVGVRSLPTLLGVDEEGRVVWRRSGRAAVAFAAQLGGRRG